MNEKTCCGKLKNIALWTGAVLGAVAGANALIASRAGTPHHELGGAFGRYPWRFGDLAYTVAGKGEPILLLHGLGAGNSMHEWSENFSVLRENFTVYAFDFLGWGLSDQPESDYPAEEFVQQVLDFARDVIGEKCVVAASSDACNYAIEAAHRQPELFSKLVLVCPPIVGERQIVPPQLVSSVKKIFAMPIVGATLNNLLTSRKSIRYFAQKQMFYDKNLAEDVLVNRHYTRGHRRGARFSVAGFLTGASRLDARDSWSELTQPALLIWGRNSTISGLETAPEWLAMKADAELFVIEKAMLLPHFEHAEQWNHRVLEWVKN